MEKRQMICEGCRRLAEVADENERLTTEIERLRAALKPFASNWRYRNTPSGYAVLTADYEEAERLVFGVEQEAGAGK
jgi:hypothetical protein